MSYMERIKAAAGTAQPAPPPTNNVTPIRPRRADEGLHPYARGIIDAWTARLDNLPRPWVHGAAWDNNCFSAARKLIELANSPWSGYTHTDAHADYMAHAPADHAWDKREKCWEQAMEYAGSTTLPEPEPGAVAPTATVLDEHAPPPEVDEAEEDAFWDARPHLRHLHTFARARRVSPWAALGVALARVITATPHHVALPPIVGGQASLNLFVGLVGPSGSGKGAAEAVAAEAINVGHIENHKTGSGEGIAHGYMKREKGEVVQHTHAVLFSVPEIDTLSALGNRQGATLMPELRSAWSGERLGFGYADPTKRLPVPAHEYRLCLVAGIQPHRAGALLDDADGGTPQRFLWMPATDPHAPDTPPACPETMQWLPPDTGARSILRQPSGAIHVRVCATARHTIDAASLARTRGEGDALDGHALLGRLKAAAGLAILDGRLEVTDHDWELSETIQRRSDATRGRVLAALRERQEESNAARAVAEAHRAVKVEETVTEAAIKRVCGVVLRKLRKEGDWVPWKTVKDATASRDRQHVPAALERLLDAGQIEHDEDATGHGNSRGKYRAKGDQ